MKMKLFFISDIHGSAYYLEKALEFFEKEKADYLVILGDQLYHGARNQLPRDYDTKKVASILNSYTDKIIAVRGNCESEVDQMVLNYPTMSDYSIILYNNKRLFLTHGHIFNKDNMPNLSDGDALIYGHTHVPLAEKINNIFVINPGSITFPKEYTPHCYGILHENIFEIKTLDGEIFKKIDF